MPPRARLRTPSPSVKSEPASSAPSSPDVLNLSLPATGSALPAFYTPNHRMAGPSSSAARPMSSPSQALNADVSAWAHRGLVQENQDLARQLAQASAAEVAAKGRLKKAQEESTKLRSQGEKDRALVESLRAELQIEVDMRRLQEQKLGEARDQLRNSKLAEAEFREEKESLRKTASEYKRLYDGLKGNVKGLYEGMMVAEAAIVGGASGSGSGSARQVKSSPATRQAAAGPSGETPSKKRKMAARRVVDEEDFEDDELDLLDDLNKMEGSPPPKARRNAGSQKSGRR